MKKTRKRIQKKHKEERHMNQQQGFISQHGVLTLVLALLAVAAAVAAAVVAVAVWLSRRSKSSGGKSKSDTGGKPAPKETPSPYALLAEKNRLEQCMASVAGGKTGLVMLLDAIQNSPYTVEQNDVKRVAFRHKQASLREYMAEYDALFAKVPALPEEDRGRFIRTQDWENYQKLLKEQA